MAKEFKCSNFGFSCYDEEQRKSFYVSQWCDNQLVFFIYRLVMAVNSLGWTIGFYVYCNFYCHERMVESYRYITLWADFLRTVYFICSAILVFMRLKTHTAPKKGIAEWVRKFTWCIHGMSISSNVAVAIFYWPFVAPELEPELAFSSLKIYQHGLNAILMIVDLLIVAFPIRLFHVVYSMALCFAYGFFTFLLWKCGDTNAVYSIINWEESFWIAVGFFIASVFIAAPICQLFTYGLYQLRKYCCKQFQNRLEEPSEKAENLKLKGDYEEC